MSAGCVLEAPPATDHGGAEPELARTYRELAVRDWPGNQLASRLPALLACAHLLDPCERSTWIGGLTRCWRKQGRQLEPDACRQLLELAASWCAWPLAASIGEWLRTRFLLAGDDALRLLAARQHLGQTEEALSYAVHLQLLAPYDHRYADVHGDLVAWARWREPIPRAGGRGWGDPALSLEPMAHHHQADFAWQYDDPSIASLCSLPEFDGAADWHAWLDRAWGYGDQLVYAIEHRDWGFIGSASLVMHGDVGFFYYWLGPDFQGQGFGPRAVSLLLEMAKSQRGLRCCYAKVFDFNLRSRRALEKIGFTDLGMRGAGEDADQLFYRWGGAISRTNVIRELHWLLDCMDAGTRPAVPLPVAT